MRHIFLCCKYIMEANKPETELLVVNSLSSEEQLLKELCLLTAETLVKDKLKLESSSNLVPILRIVMETIETKNLTGPRQKEFAKSVLKNVIETSSLDEDQKQACLELMNNGVIENTIQLVSDATKGQLNINKQAVKRSIISLLLGCLSSVKEEEPPKTQI